MSSRRFLLNSEDCELLLEFEQSGTIAKVASRINKDPSGVSRQLNKIASIYPAIEKRQGRWVLTETGRRLNSYTRDSIEMQKQLIKEEFILRIGTNREFARVILAPRIQQLKEILPKSKFMIYTFEQGVETALLSGQIDLGLDCGRPYDPDISYKRLISESIVAVATKKFFSNQKDLINQGVFIETPHLLCDRLHPDKLLGKQSNKINPVAFLNDISVAKELCLQSLGWALLPRYSVADELKQGKLIEQKLKTKGEEKYGVWWLRNRVFPDGLIKSMCSWLKNQQL